MSNLPRALGIHIYAGGFTQGMKDNLDVVKHLETSKFGVATCQENLNMEVQIDANLPVPDGKFQVVFGNPPCVAFSRLGHREYLEHPSIADVRSLLRVGLIVRPDIWTWECVIQAFTKGGDLIEEVKKAWLDAGYEVVIFLTDANLHGIAQRRHRFHFIATRVKLEFPVPAMDTWGGNCGPVLESIKPEMDIKNLQVRKYLQWMEEYALPGVPLRRVWFHLHGLAQSEPKPDGLRYCPPFCFQRLDARRPSVTLTGGPDFVHPTAWRVLSPGEMGVLSGYPSTWKWLGNVPDRYKQVAKGVTPAIGRYLGQVFRSGIEKGVGTVPGYSIIDFRHYTDEHWKNVRPPKLNPEWFGIAEDNRIADEQDSVLVEPANADNH